MKNKTIIKICSNLQKINKKNLRLLSRVNNKHNQVHNKFIKVILNNNSLISNNQLKFLLIHNHHHKLNNNINKTPNHNSPNNNLLSSKTFNPNKAKVKNPKITN